MSEITQEERQAIIAEAKKATLDELALRSKTINELEEANEALDTMRLEVNGGKSISISQLKENVQKDEGPFWEE